MLTLIFDNIPIINPSKVLSHNDSLYSIYITYNHAKRSLLIFTEATLRTLPAQIKDTSLNLLYFKKIVYAFVFALIVMCNILNRSRYVRK
jgi:hypothetical protein